MTFALQIKKYNAHLIAALLISVLALGLRFYDLSDRDLVGDEIFQYKNIAGEFKPFWGNRNLYGDHTSFPGEYLLTYPFAQTFGMNKWGLVIPHIFTTILGFYFLYRLCQRYFQTVGGTIITFGVVCFNLNLIYHSFEYRPYAVLPTLALGALYFSDRLLTQFDQIPPRLKWVMGLFFILGMPYHAFGLIIFLLPLTFTLIYRRPGLQELRQKDVVRFWRLIFLIAVPIWSWYASANYFGMAPNQGMQQAIKDPFEYIANPFLGMSGLISFLKSIFGTLIGRQPLYVLLAGLIMLLVPHPKQFAQICFFAVLIIMPIFMILYVDISAQYWFLQRQFVWVMPLFALLLGWCWDSLFAFLRSLIRI